MRKHTTRMKPSRLPAGSGLLALLIATLVSVGATLPSEPAAAPLGDGPQLGDPLDGLTADELAAFERGREIFGKRFLPSEGLGPFYNATSCVSCHSKPVLGGASGLYRNFYLGVYQWGPTAFNQSSAIPPYLSQVVPAYGSGELHEESSFTFEGGRPLIPETVMGFPVISAQRNAIPVFGVGLFELISDATIMENADPNDADLDGISGRVNTQLSGAAVGRFGTKAQVNNIELFTRGPLQNQMGITSDPLEGFDGIVSFSHAPYQVGAGPMSPTKDQDHAPDPEINAQDLSDLIAFGKFLAPPAPKPFDRSAQAGEELFETIGCAKCHIPSLPSSRGPVNAYTDLLVHFMGFDLVDNIQLGDGLFAVQDFRTQPLWGVSKFAPYLHDGRAATLHEAIEWHAGEAEAIRDAYLALPDKQRAEIISFLEHL